METTRRISVALMSAAMMCGGVALAATSSGCGPRAPYRTTADPYQPRQVSVATKRLGQQLAFQQPHVARDEAGLLHVNVPVRAATGRRQIVEYRFTYFDEAGQPLPGGAWRVATLEGNTFEHIRGNSTTPRAADFQLDIRAAERG